MFLVNSTLIIAYFYGWLNMPEVVNCKWAPISSTHSIAVNDE